MRLVMAGFVGWVRRHLIWSLLAAILTAILIIVLVMYLVVGKADFSITGPM